MTVTPLRNSSREEITAGLERAIATLPQSAFLIIPCGAAITPVTVGIELSAILSSALEQIKNSRSILGLPINHACELADRINGVPREQPKAVTT